MRLRGLTYLWGRITPLRSITHLSALELFLIKIKIKGPSWLTASNFTLCPIPQRVTWCKFQFIVDLPKNIQVSNSSKSIAEIPPVVVTTINMKTVISEKQVNEIVSASVICCHKAKIDTPMLPSEWTRDGMLSNFTVVRKPEGDIFPIGFTKEVTERNLKAGSNVIGHESSERALLNHLMTELHKFDSDVLVGHNISGFDLDVLLHKAQIARLRLDRNLDEEEEELRLSAEARAKAADPSNSCEANSKYVVDIFGQTHPPVANEIFDCMNRGRSIMAGRFAPHLEKCMGKWIAKTRKSYNNEQLDEVCFEALNYIEQNI